MYQGSRRKRILSPGRGIVHGSGAVASFGGTFWNWEEYATGAGLPDNIHSVLLLDDPVVADNTLTIDTFSVGTLGFTKTLNFTADATGNYFYVQMPAAVSTGTIRMEILCGHPTATASQADFFHLMTDLASADQNRAYHAISKNSGNPAHRGYYTTGGSASTPIDTTDTDTWASADSSGWSLCQLTYDFSTRVMGTEFKHLDSEHTTGIETTSPQTAFTAALEFARIGLRNQEGVTCRVAQVWIGTADDGWPEGLLNGVGAS